MNILKNVTNKGVYKFGIIYALVITIIGGIANYFTWHGEFSSVVLGILVFSFAIILWVALYFPMYIFVKKAKWQIYEFGFVINKRLIILSVIFIVFFIYKVEFSFTLTNFPILSLVAFARVGEEIFYRGFIYALVLKLLKSEKNSWLWAVLISSFMFAVMHTQTFLPSNTLSMFSIFLTALILGLFRAWSGSILLGSIIHCFASGGYICMISGMIIYLIIYIIGHLTKRRQPLEFERVKCSKEK